MSQQTINEIINTELFGSDRAVASEFLDFLKANDFQFVRDEAHWKNKIYYCVKYKNECVCFIAIKDPDEPENRWTVWSEDIASDYLVEDESVDEFIIQNAWKNIDQCTRCGCCSGGKMKTVFGKKFDKICGCTFRIDNPNVGDFAFMKYMVEIRKKKICSFGV